MPTIHPNRDAGNRSDSTARRPSKGKQKKLKKAVKDVVKSIPILPIVSSILREEGDGVCNMQCPNQAEYLKKAGDKWPWEDCTLCLQDRRQILEETKELVSGEDETELTILKELLYKMEPVAADGGPVNAAVDMAHESVVPDVFGPVNYTSPETSTRKGTQDLSHTRAVEAKTFDCEEPGLAEPELCQMEVPTNGRRKT